MTDPADDGLIAWLDGGELYIGRAGIAATLEAFASQREAERWVSCSPPFRRVWKVRIAEAVLMTWEHPSAGRLVLPQRDLYPRNEER